MPVDKRALKKKLYDLKKNPNAKLPGDPKVAERLLEAAKKDKAERQANSDRYIDAVAYDAAKDALAISRGRIMTMGGWGKGKTLGPGRWTYQDGKWIKKG
jgi:hypothetical protein